MTAQQEQIKTKRKMSNICDYSSLLRHFFRVSDCANEHKATVQITAMRHSRYACEQTKSKYGHRLSINCFIDK